MTLPPLSLLTCAMLLLADIISIIFSAKILPNLVRGLELWGTFTSTEAEEGRRWEAGGDISTLTCVHLSYVLNIRTFMLAAGRGAFAHQAKEGSSQKASRAVCGLSQHLRYLSSN